MILLLRPVRSDCVPNYLFHISMSSQQADGICLRFPENLGAHQSLPNEKAANMLLRAISFAQTTPFQWGYIDRPSGEFKYVFVRVEGYYMLNETCRRPVIPYFCSPAAIFPKRRYPIPGSGAEDGNTNSQWRSTFNLSFSRIHFHY